MKKKGIFEQKPVKKLARDEGKVSRTLRVPRKLEHAVEDIARRNGVKLPDAYRLLIEKGIVAVNEGALSDHLINILAKNNREVHAVKNLSRVNYRLTYSLLSFVQSLIKLISRQYVITDYDVLMKESEHEIQAFTDELLKRVGKGDGLAKRLAELEGLNIETSDEDSLSDDVPNISGDGGGKR